MTLIISQTIACFCLLAILPQFVLATTLQSAVKYPVSGEPVEVTLTGTESDLSGEIVLMAEYRPNSETGFSQEVPRDETVRNRWLFTPSSAGLVLLKAIERPSPSEQGAASKVWATLPLSVKFARPPFLGIAIMLIAGTILFGGTAVSIIRGITMKSENSNV